MLVKLDGMELSLKRKIMWGRKRRRKMWRRERLMIRSGMPENHFSQFMFSQLGLMHLIAPYLRRVRVIATNFGVVPEIRELISAMFRSEGREVPEFRGPEKKTSFSLGRTNPEKVVAAASGGKDWEWNLDWAQKAFGSDNVLAAHISGFNHGCASEERKYVLMQKEKFGFPHLRMIDLCSSSQNFGHGVVRSHRMFIVGMLVPLALEFGASKVIIEGFGETDESDFFAEQEVNMRFFNEILRKLCIPIQVCWRNEKEMEIVRQLLVHQPDWLPLVCNCFTPPYRKWGFRRLWEKRVPHFPLYQSQCGLCVKCRIVNLGRILWDEGEEMKRLRMDHRDEVVSYLKSTTKWVRDKWSTHHDMIGGSFLMNFRVAVRLYGVNIDKLEKFLARES